MKRGEIWTIAGAGEYADKPRPALILQDDEFSETGSVTICPITSVRVDASIFRIRLDPIAPNGLREVSYVMAD